MAIQTLDDNLVVMGRGRQTITLRSGEQLDPEPLEQLGGVRLGGVAVLLADEVLRRHRQVVEEHLGEAFQAVVALPCGQDGVLGLTVHQHRLGGNVQGLGEEVGASLAPWR